MAISIDQGLSVFSILLACVAWAYPSLPVQIAGGLREAKQRFGNSRLKDSVRKSRKYLATITQIQKSTAFAIAYFYRKSLFLFVFAVLDLTVQSSIFVNPLVPSEVNGYGYLVVAFTMFVCFLAIGLKATLDEALDPKLRGLVKTKHKKLAAKYRESVYGKKN